MTTNPCFSCCDHVIVNQPKCSPESCICFCDIYISPKSEDAVICGTTGSVNLFDYPNDTRVCGENSLKYTLMMFNQDFFDSVTITEAGVLTWVPASDASTRTGNLVFRVECSTISKLVTVTIGRKSNCVGVNCPQGQTCNDCSGECEEFTPNSFDLTLNV